MLAFLDLGGGGQTPLDADPLETDPPPEAGPPGCWEATPPVNRQTGVKTLPSHNFVCGQHYLAPRFRVVMISFMGNEILLQTRDIYFGA